MYLIIFFLICIEYFLDTVEYIVKAKASGLLSEKNCKIYS